MFVRFLPKSASFSAVQYNFDKVDENKAVLMASENFGLLGAIRVLKAGDYVDYFLWLTSLNHQIQNAQTHVVISAPGKSKTKEELAFLAKGWLTEMGYSSQPYLLFFHNDTANHHTHIVSSRVKKTGKVISNSFDRFRSAEAIIRLTGEDIFGNIQGAIDEVFSYEFTRKKDFKLLLEQHGYHLQEDEIGYKIYKYRRKMAAIEFNEIENRMRLISLEPSRLQLIMQTINGFLPSSGRVLYPVYQNLCGGNRGKFLGYSSLLTEYLKNSHGVLTIFNLDSARKPDGYTFIDSLNRQVFDGSLIMKLSEFTAVSQPDFFTGPPLEKTAWSVLTDFPYKLFDISLSDDQDDQAIHQRKIRDKKR